MYLYIVFIIFGLIWGSFSNALIYRLPHKISLLRPKRSICPQCNTQLKWYDNIPVISWLILLSSCRYCKNKIPYTYPLVEILNGLTAYYCYIHFSNDITTAFATYLLISVLIIITFIDLEHMIIPDLINKPGAVLGLILSLINQEFNLLSYPFSQSFYDSLMGLILGFGLLYSIAWIYQKLSGISGLGGGDIKLMAFMGSLLGYMSVFPILLTSSFIGVVLGLFVLLIKRYSLRSEFPFGPSIAIGIILYIFDFDPFPLINQLSEVIISKL